MFFTFIGVLSALVLIFFEPLHLDLPFAFLFPLIFLMFGGIVFLAASICSLILIGQLQEMEQKISGIAQAYKRHRGHQMALFMMFLFPLLSVIGVLGIQSLTFSLSYLVALWVLLFGITIDGFYHFVKSYQRMIDPFESVTLVAKNARYYFKSSDIGNFCRSIDTLSNTGLKALDTSSLALCAHAIDSLEKTFNEFLKIRTVEGVSQQEKELNYTVYFFLQCIEQINQRAIAYQLESMCKKIIVSLGRVAVTVFHYHPALVTHPINTLGKIANEALKTNFFESGLTTTITLQQIGKTALEDDPTLQLPVQDLFFSILEKLEKIAQMTFRRDKTSNINLLTQPFQEMKLWFTQEKFKDHPDATVILQDIDRIMGQFEALEAILKTMPNIPKVSEETENDDTEKSTLK